MAQHFQLVPYSRESGGKVYIHLGVKLHEIDGAHIACAEPRTRRLLTRPPGFEFRVLGFSIQGAGFSGGARVERIGVNTRHRRKNWCVDGRGLPSPGLAAS